VAVPSVASPAYALHPVIVTLTLRTKVSPACTWVVSPANVVVRVDSGEERFWTTQDCQGVVPKQVVVVRRDAATTVSMAWNGLRSDADCSRSTTWAEPGVYRVAAVAMGGADPAEARFRLLKPVRETITATPTPSPSRGATSTPSSTSGSTPSSR
jgi:hypothetical protein